MMRGSDGIWRTAGGIPAKPQQQMILESEYQGSLALRAGVEENNKAKLDAARWGAVADRMQAAQDARDRLLELNTMLMIRMLYANGAMTADIRAVADRAENAIDDLRYHTGRNEKGHRA